MLERNLLSHLRLAILLALLSATILVHTRLIPERGQRDPTHDHTKGGVVVASVQATAALGTIVAGIWQYRNHFQDLYYSRAFLANNKPHYSIMTAVAGVVLSTSIILLADQNKL